MKMININKNTQDRYILQVEKTDSELKNYRLVRNDLLVRSGVESSKKLYTMFAKYNPIISFVEKI